ncbi:MAG: hypothetical protein Q9M15_06320 [Mariprofundaceae bacterium]|nr:hypothetical protein [Mariprofundaceae bacterium]
MSDIENSQSSIGHFHATIDAAFDDVANGVEEELAGIRSQISQIESLLKDAIASLYEGFEGISDESKVQMTLMSHLMSQAVSSHDDTPNIFQRTESASNLLKRLVDISIDGSRGSLKLLKSMEGLNHRMRKTVNSEQRMTCLVQEMQDLVGEEVPNLAAIQALSQKMGQHQNLSLQEVQRVNQSISDSYVLVKELASRDMDDVYRAKQEVEDLLAHFFAITDYLSRCRNDISECNGRMRHHLGVAIRALQFEDITTQSLGHTRLHLDRMEGFVLRMTQALSNIFPVEADGVDGYAKKIKAIHVDMLQYREELALDKKNPVSQQNLDEGDVDLF